MPRIFLFLKFSLSGFQKERILAKVRIEA